MVAVMAHLFEGLMKWEAPEKKLKGSDGTCDSAKLVLTVRLRAMTKQQMMMEL